MGSIFSYPTIIFLVKHYVFGYEEMHTNHGAVVKMLISFSDVLEGIFWNIPEGRGDITKCPRAGRRALGKKALGCVRTFRNIPDGCLIGRRSPMKNRNNPLNLLTANIGKNPSIFYLISTVLFIA